MSSILPKGIVVNTPEISGDIQKIDREPLALEEIAKFWKVYTTTKRRLVDPTAERLENFWWRIWGSPKRTLRGATVARIFANISDEISFVPLRGPRNRDESGGRMVTSLTRGLGTASTTAIHGRQGSDSSYGQDSSSLSKYATTRPPPILKKSRGPSGTGPRPTARFISPKTSEEEEAAEASSSASLDAKVVVRPPTPPTPVLRELKKAETLTGPRKKEQGSIATAASHKRRPGVSRRPNSDPATRTKENASKPKKGPYKSLPDKINHEGGSRVSPSHPGTEEHAPPSSEPLLSVKESKKTQPERSGRARGIQRQGASHGQDSGQTSVTKPAPHIATSGRKDIDPIQPAGKEEDYSQKAEHAGQESRSRSQKGLTSSWQVEPQLAVGSRPSVPSKSFDTTIHSDKLVQSQHAGHHDIDITDGKDPIPVPHAYRTITTEIFHQNGSHVEPKVIQGATTLDERGKWSADDLEQTTLFAKRPVQPVKSASALFSGPTHQSNGSVSRSKSQLTLLLERDRQK